MRRAWHAEMRVLLSRIGIWISLMLPAVFGLFALLRLWMQNRQNLADLSAGNLISTSSITAFEALGVFLQAALPAAGFILAGLASQSLAGEFSRGTILHIAIRPISRIQLAVGKFLGMLTAAAICFFLTLGVGWLAAATAFDFTDVVEIMEIKGAVPFVIVEAEKLQPVVYRMIAPLGLALAAYTGLGFLAGAMTTRNGLAIGLSAGLIVLLDLGRELVRVFTAESYLISAYFPSPLRDTSPVAQLLQLIRAPNDPQAGFPESALWIPLAWLLATVFLSAILLRRRSIR
jgi:ABC-type transport system involved in multi-copper enzyme maturation permease subunit